MNTTKELTKNLIETRKNTLLDPQLSHVERVTGIRNEIAELEKPAKLGAMDAVNFAIPFATVATLAHSAIHNARTSFKTRSLATLLIDLSIQHKRKEALLLKTPMPY